MFNVQHTLIIAVCILFNTSCLFAQKFNKIIPSEIGLNLFIQRTQTMMHSQRQSPYYLVNGFNNGIGLNIKYNICRKINFKVWYNYAKLINTYDISRSSPIFTVEDSKQYHPFSYYWKAHEIGIGLDFKIYSKNKNTLKFEQSFCSNYGALVYDHFPFTGGLSDTLYKDIKYEGGENGELSYTIVHASIRNMGFNYLSGISYVRELNNNLKFNISLAYNFGIIPLIGTRIDFRIKNIDNPNTNGFQGQQYATSSNSGIRLGFGINYTIRNYKPKS